MDPIRLQPQASPLLDFRGKAAGMAEVALEDAYVIAIDKDTPLKTKLEFVDLCAKLADLHPKTAQINTNLPNFSINVVFDGPQGQKPVNVLEHVPDKLETQPILPLATPDFHSAAIAVMQNLDLQYAEPELQAA